MLGLKTRKEFAEEAHKLAVSYGMVRCNSVTYLPLKYDSLLVGEPCEPAETVWVPLTRAGVQELAANQFQTLFASDSELKSFDYMVAQNAAKVKTPDTGVLVRTSDGLRLLTVDGVLEEPSGEFVPNYIHPMFTPDDEAKAEVKAVLLDWLGDDEEVDSLLHHLATSLAPQYSAVKYVLLLGHGRNGKGLLIKMMQALFGSENVSHVSRQYMSEMSPAVVDLNGKLLNLVFDGSSDYIKDSGPEKTLVAGEPLSVRMLYESSPTVVQTNALFIEALNQEPKSKDKSQALQKRLVRFWFTKTFKSDLKFERHMLSPRMLSGFLQLLIEHYVVESELAFRLAPTAEAMRLQVEYESHNSVALQFLQHVHMSDPFGVDHVIGLQVDELCKEFKEWRVEIGDKGFWSDPDILTVFKSTIVTERKSVRTPAGPRKKTHVAALTASAETFIETLTKE